MTSINLQRLIYFFLEVLQGESLWSLPYCGLSYDDRNQIFDWKINERSPKSEMELQD